MRERIGIKAKDWIELFRNFTTSNNNENLGANDKEGGNYIGKATEISESDRKQLEEVLRDLEERGKQLEKQGNGKNRKTTRKQSTNKAKFNNEPINEREIKEAGRERE